MHNEKLIVILFIRQFYDNYIIFVCHLLLIDVLLLLKIRCENGMKQKQDKFLELFEPVKINLWRFCLSISPCGDDAKDLLQDTIESAYKNFEQLRGGQAFLSWLFTIASRINMQRAKKRKQKDFRSMDDCAELVSGEASPEELMDVAILYSALDKLSPEQKEAVILFDIIGIPQKEIAEIQSVSVDTVKQRIHRGKERLREIISPINHYSESKPSNAELRLI